MSVDGAVLSRRCLGRFHIEPTSLPSLELYYFFKSHLSGEIGIVLSLCVSFPVTFLKTEALVQNSAERYTPALALTLECQGNYFANYLNFIVCLPRRLQRRTRLTCNAETSKELLILFPMAVQLEN